MGVRVSLGAPRFSFKIKHLPAYGFKVLEVIFGSVFGTSKSENPAYAPGFLLLKNRSKPQPARVPLVHVPSPQNDQAENAFSAFPKLPLLATPEGTSSRAAECQIAMRPRPKAKKNRRSDFNQWIVGFAGSRALMKYPSSLTCFLSLPII